MRGAALTMNADHLDGDALGPRPWFLLSLLMTAMVFSIVDRQVLALLVEPIKADLALSDTQLSLLLGPAFVSFYLLFGLPFGWAADRFQRRYVIALGIGVWSIATITCGLASSFLVLVCARALVGAGEASLTPSSMSMLSDVFSREQMPFVTSVLSIAMHIGAASALLIGGAVLSLVGENGVHFPIIGIVSAWQATFLTVGLPGLALVLVFASIREPLRTSPTGTEQSESALSEATKVLGIGQFYVMHRLTLNVHISVAALLTICTYAFVSWTPAYLIRVHAYDTESAALALGVVSLIFGPLGAIGGGALTRHLQQHRGRVDAAWLVMAASAFGACVFGALAFLSTTRAPMLVGLVLAILFGSLYLGVVHGSLQMITPTPLKGRMSAIMLLAMTGVGTALAPVLVALLTDQVFADPQRVGDSIAVVAGSAGVLAGTLLLRSLESFQRSYYGLDTTQRPQSPGDQQ